MSLPTLTGLDCGWMSTQRRTLLDGAGTEELSMPIISWLVRHRSGNLVFDAGLHADLAATTDRLGSLAKIFTVDLGVGGTVGPRLAEHGVDPLSSLTVVLSHCHFDHCGGLEELPNARVLVHRDEWRAAAEGGGGYDLSLIDHGHDVIHIDREHDVFGDGTVVCFPTPGHTCGHQSLRVRTASRTIILAGDACYFDHTLDDGLLPPFAFDLDEQRRSLQMLQRARAAGATIVPGHDATVFRALSHD